VTNQRAGAGDRRGASVQRSGTGAARLYSGRQRGASVQRPARRVRTAVGDRRGASVQRPATAVRRSHSTYYYFLCQGVKIPRAKNKS